MPPLTEYTKWTGKDPRNHPFASKIDIWDSPESILDIFQEQAQAFDEFRNGDAKLVEWLKPVVGVLLETSDGTYEQSLRRIDRQKRRDFVCDVAYFGCLVVSGRPHRVKELTELFAIQPDVDTIPMFDARWRPENPEEFILCHRPIPF
jgi:hypothetical protein